MEKDVLENLTNEELKIKLSNFEVAQGDLDIRILFYEKKSANGSYKTYNLDSKEKFFHDAIQKIIVNILLAIESKSIQKYDIEFSKDDSIQYIKKDEVMNSLGIIEAISNKHDCIDSETKLSNIKFVVIKIKLKDASEIVLFQRFYHEGAKFSKSSKFIFMGKEPQPIETEIISINSYIDAILVDGYYYILERNGFNSIFNYRDAFINIVKSKENQIVDSDIFVNAEPFINECINDARYTPRLVKVLLYDGFKIIKDYKENIKKIKKDFKLELCITDDGQIDYNCKKDAGEILNLLLQHHVISALTDNKMIALAIEQYNTALE